MSAQNKSLISNTAVVRLQMGATLALVVWAWLTFVSASVRLLPLITVSTPWSSLERAHKELARR